MERPLNMFSPFALTRASSSGASASSCISPQPTSPTMAPNVSPTLIPNLRVVFSSVSIFCSLSAARPTARVPLALRRPIARGLRLSQGLANLKAVTGPTFVSRDCARFRPFHRPSPRACRLVRNSSLTFGQRMARGPAPGSGCRDTALQGQEGPSDPTRNARPARRSLKAGWSWRGCRNGHRTVTVPVVKSIVPVRRFVGRDDHKRKRPVRAKRTGRGGSGSGLI